MSEAAAAAARSSYLISGHAEGGLLHVVPISGMEAPNAIPFRPRTLTPEQQPTSP
jgi:hypothetical protein